MQGFDSSFLARLGAMFRCASACEESILNGIAYVATSIGKRWRPFPLRWLVEVADGRNGADEQARGLRDEQRVHIQTKFNEGAHSQSLQEGGAR